MAYTCINNLHNKQENRERGDNMCGRNLNKLKGKLVENGKTYKDGAKALGVSTNTFNDKINGKRKFYVDEVNKLSELLKLTDKEKIDIFLN